MDDDTPPVWPPLIDAPVSATAARPPLLSVRAIGLLLGIAAALLAYCATAYKQATYDQRYNYAGTRVHSSN